MVMKADVIASAIESHLETVANPRFLPFSNSTSPHKSRVQIFQKVDLRHGHLFQNSKPSMKIIYLSPRGKVFNQKMAQELAQEKEIMVLCGRYEGVDQRVLDEFAIEEISIGDYVLSGGEIAAYVFIDAILRNISGILGDDESLKEESFSFGNILEYPHYTKPSEWRGCKIPEILLSGHHKKIAEWRKMKAMELTKKIRPDLLEKKPDEPK